MGVLASRSNPPSPRTWRARVYLLVWVVIFELSGKADAASSYAAAGIALGIIWPLRPYHYIKLVSPSVGVVFADGVRRKVRVVAEYNE